jgi:hypothetical protein
MHLGQAAAWTDEDVIDHTIGRGDLAMAVMPRELDQFQQVKCGERVRAPEDGFNLRSPCGPARRPPHHHDGLSGH